jgi:outer membrane protein assembly factor BamB
MCVQSTALLALTAVAVLWPVAALAKRADPAPVPPVVWNGVEYRAPLDVEQMGRVQAFDLSSGRKVWETKVYHVWILPLTEEDVQWVFISSMRVQDGTLLVKNEKGRSFRLNLKTGRIDGEITRRVIDGLLVGVVLLVWARVAQRRKVAAATGKTAP